jgi:outer membrane protein TolC
MGPALAPLGFVLAALLMTGCAGWRPVPKLPSAVAVPAGWAETTTQVAGTRAGPPPLAAWWRRYNDPLLVRLVDEALRANPSLRGARAALSRSRSLREAEAAAGWPVLGASLDAQRQRTGAGGSGGAGQGSASSFRAGFDASWEPDVFGGRHAAVAAADADLQASAAALAGAQVSLAAEVAVDVLQLRGLQLRLRIAQASLASQSETLQLTLWRVQAGLLTDLEAEQARTATEQTRAQVPDLQTSLAQTGHALAALTGRAPSEMPAGWADGATASGRDVDPHTVPNGARPSVPNASPEAVLPPVQPLGLRGPDPVPAVPADTLRQRPDVRQAEAVMMAAAQRVAQADAARWPRFTLSGSLGANAATLAGLGQGAALVAVVLGNASATLFDGGALRARWQAQQSAFEQSAAAYDSTVLAALQDVEDSLVALRRLRERRASLQVAADAANAAATLASQRYRSGLIDFQVLLETQRSALSTQDALARTETDLNTGQVRLYKALGGGWADIDTQGITQGVTQGVTDGLTRLAGAASVAR